MNHPTPEEWMSFLYNESTKRQKREMAAHLETCAECQAIVEPCEYARAELSKWTFMPRVLAGRNYAHGWIWAAAAAVVLFLGVSAEHLASARTVDANEVARIIAPRLRTQVQDALQQQLDSRIAAATARANLETAQLVTRLSDSLTALREGDKAEMINLLKQFETDQATRLAAMRADLETVAIVGETRLRTAQQEIGNLATLSEAAYRPGTQKP